MDLPDDDYTTLVPPLKQLAGTSRKLPLVPSAIENKEADALSATGRTREIIIFIIALDGGGIVSSLFDRQIQ